MSAHYRDFSHVPDSTERLVGVALTECNPNWRLVLSHKMFPVLHVAWIAMFTVGLVALSPGHLSAEPVSTTEVESKIDDAAVMTNARDHSLANSYRKPSQTNLALTTSDADHEAQFGNNIGDTEATIGSSYNRRKEVPQFVSYACPGGDYFSVVSLDSYQDEHEATRNFDCYHKLGTGIARFLDRNIRLVDRYESQRVNIITGEEVVAHVMVYTTYVERKYENTWRIMIFENDGNIQRREIRLYYDGQNFLERNIPFRFENFDDSGMKVVLDRIVQTLEPRNLEAVQSFMSGVGAKLSWTQEDGDVARHRYVYEEDASNDLTSYIIGWPPKWSVLFEFNSDGGFLNMHVSGRYGS